MSTVCQLHRDSLHHGETTIDLSTALSTMLFVMADERVVLIKLADRLHNMRTISALPQHKQAKIAEETLSVFAPIISHLGVWHLKAELEDLCFKVSALLTNLLGMCQNEYVAVIGVVAGAYKL